MRCLYGELIGAHDCSCVNVFIKQNKGKEIKCKALFASPSCPCFQCWKGSYCAMSSAFRMPCTMSKVQITITFVTRIKQK